MADLKSWENLDVAIGFYELAVCRCLINHKDGVFSIEDIYAHYNYTEEPYPTPILVNEHLMAMAISRLEAGDALETLQVKFAPLAFVRSAGLDRYISAKQSDGRSPFSIYARLGSGSARWLREAVANVDTEAQYLDIDDGIQAVPKLDLIGQEEWEPIALDREDVNLSIAISHTEAAFEEIRGDNGYAATYPDEREDTVVKIASGLDLLKRSGAVNVNSIRTLIIGPLTRAIFRLGRSSAGTAAAVARQTIVKWLADHMEKVPAWIESVRHFL